MSDRPTISIYANDRIVECYYLRNWPMGQLLSECRRIIRKIGSTTKLENVLELLGKDPLAVHDEEHLESIEDASEFPVVIDLSRRLVYLKDEYAEGHPGANDLPVVSAEDYGTVCDEYVVFPHGRPLTFNVIEQICIE